MRKTVQFFAIMAIAATSFTACKKEENNTPQPPQPVTKAKVVFVHACADANSINAFINDGTTATANDLAYLQTSGYKEIDPVSNANVKFRFSGGSILTQGTQTFEVNKYYSVFAAGQVTNNSFVAFTDDLSAPASGKAKVRFINLSADNLDEDIYVGAAKIDSNVAYKMATVFHEVNPGTMNVIMQDPANVPASRNKSFQFDAGKIYTVILTGTGTAPGMPADLTLTSILHN